MANMFKGHKHSHDKAFYEVKKRSLSAVGHRSMVVEVLGGMYGTNLRRGPISKHMDEQRSRFDMEADCWPETFMYSWTPSTVSEPFFPVETEVKIRTTQKSYG